MMREGDVAEFGFELAEEELGPSRSSSVHHHWLNRLFHSHSHHGYYCHDSDWMTDQHDCLGSAYPFPALRYHSCTYIHSFEVKNG